MPVYVLLNEMPAEEFKKWILYFQARPIGWREDRRSAILAQMQAGSKINSEEIFPSLRAVRQYEEEKSDEEVMNSSLSSSIFGARLSSALKKD